MSDPSDAIADFLTDAMVARARAVETACEQALADGRYGVSVRTTVSGAYGEAASIVTEAWVDPEVPYGEVHDHGLVFPDPS